MLSDDARWELLGTRYATTQVEKRHPVTRCIVKETTADTMDSVATSGVVATMTRKPRDDVASVGRRVVRVLTDLSGNGKHCDVQCYPSYGIKKALS